jgi:hypothetical protein
LRVSEEGKRAWEKKTFDKIKMKAFQNCLKKQTIYICLWFSAILGGRGTDPLWMVGGHYYMYCEGEQNRIKVDES